MHLRWLALKNVRLLHPSLKFRKISIFLAFSGSFSVKNDNIHTFFRCFSCKQNLPALLQNKNTWIGPFPWKRSVYCKILTEKEPISAQGFTEDGVCHITKKIKFDDRFRIRN